MGKMNGTFYFRNQKPSPAVALLPEAGRKLKIVVYFDTRGEVYFCIDASPQSRGSKDCSSLFLPLWILNVVENLLRGFSVVVHTHSGLQFEFIQMDVYYYYYYCYMGFLIVDVAFKRKELVSRLGELLCYATLSLYTEAVDNNVQSI